MRCRGIMRGEVSNEEGARREASRDTSLFERMPELVVYPVDANDVSELVRVVDAERSRGAEISVTARSAGTDMSGGPLTTSIVVSFTKHMNRMLEVLPAQAGGDGYAVTEPGVFYRDFEKATMEKGLIMPSYPASREIAAMGGIVANDAGGERTLRYGKTEKYVEEVEVVLSDGSQATFGPLTPEQLEGEKEVPNA